MLIREHRVSCQTSAITSRLVDTHTRVEDTTSILPIDEVQADDGVEIAGQRCRTEIADRHGSIATPAIDGDTCGIVELK